MNENKSRVLYADIIDLCRPISKNRHPMPRADRAAQFASFQALTGYGDKVTETARLTSRKREPDEERRDRLNRILNRLIETADSQPFVKVVYFEQDERKSGGRYVTAEGRFRRIDSWSKTIIFTDGTVISILNIWDIFREEKT